MLNNLSRKCLFCWVRLLPVSMLGNYLLAYSFSMIKWGRGNGAFPLCTNDNVDVKSGTNNACLGIYNRIKPKCKYSQR